MAGIPEDDKAVAHVVAKAFGGKPTVARFYDGLRTGSISPPPRKLSRHHGIEEPGSGWSDLILDNWPVASSFDEGRFRVCCALEIG